ncbi:MAG: PspC domain-containing protein [Acidobacteria bacterium]|nr:PspC domain-containing protein [Acidobacteriota bacterium]
MENQQTPGGATPKQLRRSLVDRRIGGVCGGIARYLDTDPVFIRVLWLGLTVAGLLGLGIGIFLGVFAYIVCWLIVPEAEEGSEPIVQGVRRLERSSTDIKLAGVCGGIASFFGVDPSAVRVLWVLLTLCTLLIGGLLIYLTAWIIMPLAATPAAAEPAPAPAPAEEGSPPPTEATASPADAVELAGDADAAAPVTDSTASTTDTAAEEPRS